MKVFEKPLIRMVLKLIIGIITFDLLFRLYTSSGVSEADPFLFELIVLIYNILLIGTMAGILLGLLAVVKESLLDKNILEKIKARREILLAGCMVLILTGIIFLPSLWIYTAQGTMAIQLVGLLNLIKHLLLLIIILSLMIALIQFLILQISVERRSQIED